MEKLAKETWKKSEKKNNYQIQKKYEVKGFKQISPEIEKTAYKKAWSIGSMEGHDAAGRSVKYIGSSMDSYVDGIPTKGRYLTDYFIDSEGDYWYSTRVMLPSGELISMEEHIFGKKTVSRPKHSVPYGVADSPYQRCGGSH